MTKDEIKKGLEYAAKVTGNGVFAGAYKIITEQEKEIDFQVQDRARLQREIDELEQAHEQRVEEIERLKVDYSKLQEAFANYQLASDKEIRAQVKQAQLDILGKLWSNISNSKQLIQSHIADGSFTIEDIYMEIDELIKEVQK